MRNTASTVVVLAAVLAWCPPLLAQADESAAVAPLAVTPRTLTNMPVIDVDDATLGRVETVVRLADSDRLLLVIADAGGRRMALPLEQVAAADGQLHLRQPAEKQALQQQAEQLETAAVAPVDADRRLTELERPPQG